MKEPYRKGVANRPDPESCAGDGNIAGEALTGAHAGQLSSSEITSIGVPTLSTNGEGNMRSDANRKSPLDAAESETLSMCGNSMHGNRETLETPLPDGGRGRSEKASCRTTDMHVSRESDGPIVPEKRANKAGPKAAAEPWREGDRPRETPLEPYSRRTPSRGSVEWDCGAYERLQSGIRSCGLPRCCTMFVPNCSKRATSR